MSADNWAQCPHCIEQAESAYADLQRRVKEGYGVLPLAEFDALRAEAEKPLKIQSTWREDYEIYGAETGEVTVDYRGKCTVCGLELKFTDSHRIESMAKDDSRG